MWIKHFLRDAVNEDLPEGGSGPDVVVDTPTPEPSLKDTLRENLAAEMARDETVPKVAAPVVESAEDKRARDEKGRFAGVDPNAPKVEAPALDALAAPVVGVQPPPSLTTAEKAEFAKAPPAMQAFISGVLSRREADTQRGIAPMREALERARPLAEAIQPFVPLLEQHGRNPAEWINTMGTWHQAFATGSPEQRLDAALRLIRDYNVPIAEFLQQGGQLPQFNPNAPQRQAPAQQAPDVRALVQAELEAHTIKQQVQQFQEAKDAKGDPLYPHYETLKQTMIGLLQSGAAADLPRAYKLAVRTDDILLQQELDAKAADSAAEKAAAASARVARARSQTVSPRSATPSAAANLAGDRSLKDTLRENFRNVVGGRV